MDATELKLLLADRAEEVCQHLLPAGKRQGREWKVGGLNNEPGNSLGVCLSGTKAGVYADFAANVSGSNLLDLWMNVKQIGYVEALEQASRWAGVSLSDGPKFFRAAAQKPKPIEPAKKEFYDTDPLSESYEYLVGERKIPEEILKKYRIGDIEGAYVFPSYSVDGNTLEMWKAVAIERPEGKKKTWTSKNAAKVLFGKHACANHSGTLVITEGEIDAMSVAQFGLPAVSVPYGAKCDTPQGTNPNDEWIQNDWDWLQQFHTILLCFDSDEAGQAAVRDLVPRLGRERCSVIKLPEGRKDANECLTAGDADALAKAILEPIPCDPEEITGVEHWIGAVNKLNDPDAPEEGTSFILDIEFRVRPSELTIWTGTSGSGKTTFLLNAMVGQAAQGQKCCIASFEMTPTKTLNIVACQAGNLHNPYGDKLGECFGWMYNKFFIYHTEKRVQVDKMIEGFRYARRRYGVTQFVVDSLMMCGIASDDYVGQANVVRDLVNFAKAERVHVHLVAHSKKLATDKSEGGKMDVKGASEITDLAFNVATVWRDLEKEEARQRDEFLDTPDGKLSFSKQRETGEHPFSVLYFNPKTRRFRGTPIDNSRAFFEVPKPRYGGEGDRGNDRPTPSVASDSETIEKPF